MSKKLQNINDDSWKQIPCGTADRKWIVYDYLPNLEGKILYVGVNYYTGHYCNRTKSPKLFETLDVCPERSAEGASPHGHHLMLFQDLNPDIHKYDHISLHGLHGFEGHKINNDAYNILADLKHADSLLNPGGTLQWGPNYLLDKFDVFIEVALNLTPLRFYETIKMEYMNNFIYWGRKNA